MSTERHDDHAAAPADESAQPGGLSRRDFMRAAGGATAAMLAARHLPGAVPEAAAATGNEICRMDAVTLAGHIRAKRLSPVEVVNAVLDRMDKLEPVLHAFCTPTPDLARETAERLEDDIMKGRRVGPLAGVPVGIKDLVLTKGIRTTSGSIIYKDFVPDEDDVVVERLKDAGAVILGKTNVPELGYSGASYNMIFPATRNPWNIERTSGGSSAGSGAAVASGMGPFAIGSDGGGSIRIPAAFCGLYGLKASMGRVPLYPGTKDERYPGVSGWESIEHIGPLSRTVADAALMMSVIAGPDARDRHTLPEPNFNWMDTLQGAIMARKAVANKSWRFFHKYDLLLTPTTAVAAFPLGIQGPETIEGKKAGPFQWLPFTFPFNMTGQPAATVPAGFTSDGLPVGLQIVGRHLDDPAVLRASAAYEAAAPWKDRWPPLLANMGL